MKKFYITIALVLWSFTQIAEAQNLYRQYLSNSAVPQPSSTVSIMHSNGLVYFFQADDNGNLSAAEINPMNMIPTGNDTAFHFQNGNVYLNGCFENANGDFVLFGYYHEYNNPYSYQSPAYILVEQNFSGCAVYYLPNVIWDEFIAGCTGYNVGGMEIYLFVNGAGKLVADSAATPGGSPHGISLLSGPAGIDRYTDISWDGKNGFFIATGSARNSPTGHEDPFVHVFKLFNNFTVDTKAEYYLCNQVYEDANEYKSLHTQLDDNHLILYHDLRHIVNNPNPLPVDTVSYVHDIVWITRIKNFWDNNLATYIESMFYELPTSKLSAKDMLYDPYNNRLDFLGYINHCQGGLTHLLAQIDPYMLSSGIEIGQLGATFMGDTCHNYQIPFVDIYYNNMYFSNLALNTNNSCYPLLIAGVCNKLSLLTETYDISHSRCDMPMWHKDTKADPIINSYPLNISYSLDTFQFANTNNILENVMDNILCNEPNACSYQYKGKVLQYFLTNGNIAAHIYLEDNHQFVCEGFEGKIKFFLFDIAGKILQQGITHNGERNLLKISNGIYLLKAMDANGTQIIKKTVVL